MSVTPSVSPSVALAEALRLAANATEGLADTAEGVHEAVWRTLGVPGARPGRTRGITGFVYRRVRGTARRVARGARWARDIRLFRGIPGSEPGAVPAGAIAALNGVLGDHLEAAGSPLATALHLRTPRGPLASSEPVPEATGHVVVFVHGLCLDETSWRSGSADYGARLARAGWTPLYVRYNTGRPIEANGRDLARSLKRLVADWPVPVERLALVGHSMGGLVIRRALEAGLQDRAEWTRALAHVVTLGTPHAGSPLERWGSWVDRALGRSRFTRPFVRIGGLRSAGITDLRHGLPDPGPEGLPAARYTVAALQSGPLQGPLGDGLVPQDSAFGWAGAEPLLIPHTGHFALTTHPAVADALVAWLAPPEGS